MRRFLLRWGWLYLLGMGIYFIPDVTPLTEKYWAGICIGMFVGIWWKTNA